MGPFLWPSAGMPSPLVEDSKAKGYKGKLWEFFVKVLFLLGDSGSWSAQTGGQHRAGMLRVSRLPYYDSATPLTWGQWVQKWSYLLQNTHKSKITSGENPPSKKDWIFNKICFVFSVGKVSLANTSKYLRNLWDSEGLLLFSWEERALSRLGSSACGEVCLGPDSSGLVYSPARHGFGKSFMGEQTIQGPICA